MEFGGPVVEELPMDDRFSLTNMTIEAGGQTGFVDPDDTTREYVEERVDGEYTLYESDEDADFDRHVEIDCEDMEPRIAVPSNPENVKPISEVQGTEIDQAVVGSCTNCRVEDLRQAAEILEGNRIDEDVRLVVTPGTRHIQSVAHETGWMETFHRAGANVGSPGCGACFGENSGALTEDETCIATTNRNFVGRMGPESSEVYLSNPTVAAASSLTGEITHPGEVV
jgi:3-isopropylmalate/(R)-2-methylmalate dehydratase large subunit